MTDEQENAELEGKIIIDGGEEEATKLGSGAAEEKPPEKTEEEKKQESIQAAINKQHAKYREEERKRIEVEATNKTLQDELDTLKAASGDVVIPPIPDAYDEDYEEKIRIRDTAIVKKAEADAQKVSLVASQKAATNQAAAERQERVVTAVSGYDARALQLGLSVDDVKKAGDTVIDYGISEDIAMFLLEDTDGPLLTQYLASNPLELDDLRGMSTINAALLINSTIREKAALLKPKAPGAPAPADTLHGNGAPEKVPELIKGATFE